MFRLENKEGSDFSVPDAKAAKPVSKRAADTQRLSKHDSDNLRVKICLDVWVNT